jgi:bifunctional non-homologous end joining protein LigD
MMRKIEWVNPVFVCQVKFAEWTRDGKLRQPVFLGMREDKKPAQVVRERPQA